jgi:hypothetical protein
VGAGLIGGIAGWLEGKTVAEGISPDEEMKYWSDNYSQRPYHQSDRTWDDYRPAYLAGIYTYSPKQRYDEAEKNIESDWHKIRGKSQLSWDEARLATRDAWDRLDRSRH